MEVLERDLITYVVGVAGLSLSAWSHCGMNHLRNFKILNFDRGWLHRGLETRPGLETRQKRIRKIQRLPLT